MPDLRNEPGTEIEQIRAEELGFDAAKAQGMLFKNRLKGDLRKKKIASILIVVLILAVGTFGYKKWFMSSDNIEYSTAVISKGTVTDYVEATGTLSAVKQSDMGFKNDDTITAINVQSGDEVKAGQVLAQQDPTSLQATLQQAVSTVEQDEISIKSAQLTYETNRKTMERQQRLFDAEALAQTDLDTAKNDLTKSEWEVATAKSKLKIDQTKVAQAQADVDACTLVAPFDGIIGEVNGQVGQINGINTSSSTLLTIMSKELELTALVNEADIGRIKVNQDAEFTSSSFNKTTFQGKVKRITPQATSVSSVQYYPVLISCEDPDQKLLSGMSVSVKVIVSQKKDVLTVPMMAISFAQSYMKSETTAPASKHAANSTNRRSKTGQTSGTKPQLPGSATGTSPSGMTAVPAVSSTSSENTEDSTAAQTGQRSFVVVMKNGKTSLQNVVLGLSDGSNYQVIQGLNEGDQVVVGSTQLDSTTESSSGSSNSSTSKTRQNQSGGMPGGMGGPPPGM